MAGWVKNRILLFTLFFLNASVDLILFSVSLFLWCRTPPPPLSLFLSPYSSQSLFRCSLSHASLFSSLVPRIFFCSFLHFCSISLSRRALPENSPFDNTVIWRLCYSSLHLIDCKWEEIPVCRARLLLSDVYFSKKSVIFAESADLV